MGRSGICKKSIESMFSVLMAMFQALNGMDIRYGKCNMGGIHIYSEEIPFLNRSNFKASDETNTRMLRIYISG
jgi:hypothetical protein